MDVQEQQNIENIYASIPQSLICKFVTHLTEFSLDDVEIDVSTDLDEDAFNKILREMLENTVDQQTLDKVSFDFLVQGKLLRGKMKSHLIRYEIGCEKVIQIQYFIAFRNMQEMKQNPEEDWVSAICALMGVQQNIGVLTAMFDGTVSFHTGKQTKKLSKDHSKVHQDPIKAIKSLPSVRPEVYYTITGGLGEQIKISTFKQGQSFKQLSTNQHPGSVLALDINPILDGHFCSVGSVGNLSIYKIPDDFMDEDYNEISTTKKKKKKANIKNVPRITQQSICAGSPINSVSWFNSTQIAAGCSDHSIRIIDVTGMKSIRSLLTKDSITTGIDFSNNCIISSHEDGYIRLWDLKSSNSPVSTFKSHSKYASCVSYGASSNIFASGSYDQTLKVWDTRSVFPLQTIATDYDKVFALAWLNESTIVSGGSSPFVTFHST